MPDTQLTLFMFPESTQLATAGSSDKILTFPELLAASGSPVLS